MYDLVGEERFLAATLASRMSQARLYVGKVSEDPTEPPEAVDKGPMAEALGAIGPSQSGLAQMVQRLGVNLFVAGEGWLGGVPSTMLPASLRPAFSLDPQAGPEEKETSGTDLQDLSWRVLSISEVSLSGGNDILLRLGPNEEEQIRCSPDNVFLIRVWRPHPRRWWEADSPTRSSLAVLRELVGLTMHISAQVDSRLAGAGLLIVPQSAQRAMSLAQDSGEAVQDDSADHFTEALMEAMLTPINDRANASALVPLVVTVPDEVTGSFNYLTFAKPLDTEARNLRDEAIRRLALGQDAPPELLLGTGGLNHWGAWLIREDVVSTHIEPPLALICDAITTQYLWPVLLDLGMTEDEAHSYVVWYDVSEMVMRPNRSQDAIVLHERGVISDEALRDATGFSEADAPEVTTSPVDEILLRMVEANPALVYKPGVNALREQLTAIAEGAPVDPPPRSTAPPASGIAPTPPSASPSVTAPAVRMPTTAVKGPVGLPVDDRTAPDLTKP